ncbi:MAG: NAD(P)/FAD-dependent oxidoreductase [Acidobacteriota bacterium]
MATNPSNGPRVVVIGAGMSGLLMGIKLLEAGISNFVIYEKALKVGGTWRENTYPNVACDIFSPAYSYSFETNAEWNFRFGRGEEIQRYFEGVSRKYGLDDYITFGADISQARWDGACWRIELADGRTDAAEVLVSAVGGLHFPRVPDIPGLDTFAGPSFHTARWDHTVNIRDKRVGVIGTGSTAAQVVPGIVDKVSELFLFQRTAQWILPTRDRKYSDRSKRWRREHAWLARLIHRCDLLLPDIVSAGVRGNKFILSRLDRECRHNLATVRDPELRRELTPNYPVACKRLVVSEDFYPAIQRPNAHLVTAAIEKIVPEGVVTRDGTRTDLDVLVLSTGFYPYKTTVNVVGDRRQTLAETWGGSPLTHRTVDVPGFPNFFVVFGPYSPIGNMSIIENSEIQAGYIMKCIDLITRGRVRTLNPRREVAEREKEDIRKALKKTVWQSGCQSWYLDENGEAVSWPWSLRRFRRDLRGPVLSEYDVG